MTEKPTQPVPTQRRRGFDDPQSARAASYDSWAQTQDRSARTRNARAAAQDRFERQVDPDGLMSPEGRALAAEAARKAFYTRFSMIGVEARRRKAKKRS